MMSQMPRTMRGACLAGHGEPEKLALRNDLPLPRLTAGDGRFQVHAASVNNTDMNTRTGRYSNDALPAQTGYGKGRNQMQTDLIETIFNMSDDVRYVAVYRHGHLESRSRAARKNASGTESDRYEELLVNPTLLKLSSQRGNIDCGGLTYLLVRYGNFFQLIVPTDGGHLSVCIEKSADPLPIASRVVDVATNQSTWTDC